MKATLLTGNCSTVVLLLENGQQLIADSNLHDIQKMIDAWKTRYEVTHGE